MSTSRRATAFSKQPVEARTFVAALGAGDTERGLPRSRLRHPISVNVEAEHASIVVGKILNQEFWQPMPVLIRHGERSKP
jgi:hypothetical protein